MSTLSKQAQPDTSFPLCGTESDPWTFPSLTHYFTAPCSQAYYNLTVYVLLLPTNFKRTSNSRLRTNRRFSTSVEMAIFILSLREAILLLATMILYCTNKLRLHSGLEPLESGNCSQTPHIPYSLPGCCKQSGNAYHAELSHECGVDSIWDS